MVFCINKIKICVHFLFTCSCFIGSASCGDVPMTKIWMSTISNDDLSSWSLPTYWHNMQIGSLQNAAKSAVHEILNPQTMQTKLVKPVALVFVSLIPKIEEHIRVLLKRKSRVSSLWTNKTSNDQLREVSAGKRCVLAKVNQYHAT